MLFCVQTLEAADFVVSVEISMFTSYYEHPGHLG